MKLKQSWKSELADHASPAYQILAGNLATAVSKAPFFAPFSLPRPTDLLLEHRPP